MSLSSRLTPRPHPLRRSGPILAIALLLATGCAGWGGGASEGGAIDDPTWESESPFYRDVRQLTFAGQRSGEGYLSRDGREIVFQSEREPDNPFYQIYRMNLETGETRRISSGVGRTTCAWIHPDGDAVLYASTHLAPNVEETRLQELEDRETGRTRRYAWPYDEHYDLFVARSDGRVERLTEARGYDAEGSFSPDGRWIAFSSNRHAYADALTPEERDRLAEDPSYFLDLYLFDTEDGTLRRLTNTSGYDGGPFFSPDGERIVWRRFTEDGAVAEIHSIRLDGTDERLLTRLGAMSWAPYYHPSGDYVIFTTNRHGYDNFELYIVDAQGLREPVRVAQREGFDGLPVFAPSGDELFWTSNATPGDQSQIFRADWDDAAARAALGLGAPSTPSGPAGLALPSSTDPHISADDLEAHVAALTDPSTEGRATGSAGEERAADYLERAMQAIGLAPAGDNGGYRHRFDFTAGISLGDANRLELEASGPSTSESSSAPTTFEIDREWRPLAFSKIGEIPASPVVFAGYGLVAPASNGLAALDAYAELDVHDRWVMVLRDLPQTLEGETRQHVQRYASLRHKAMIARDRGARGVLFVSGPHGRFREELVPLRFDASLAGTRIAVLSLGDLAADEILRISGKDIDALQSELDQELQTPGFEIQGSSLSARIDLVTQRSEGTNVVGRLQVGERPSTQTIVLGAHFDHLGRGAGGNSLASGDEVGQIHPGADDNASGVAVLLEIAEQLVHRLDQDLPVGERDFVFAAWSGEELGILGSNHWVSDQTNPHGDGEGPVAYLNFDMVGRLRERLIVQGLGSSAEWSALLESAAAPLDLAIVAQNDSYLPTDTTSFYTRGIPILAAFTGVHSEYHTPRDQPELLDLEGAARIGELFTRIAESLSRATDAPTYSAQEAPSSAAPRSGFRVFLGTVPDYAQSDVQGVKLSGVAPGGPAEDAGLRRGDIIVEVDGRPIENLYDYTYALEALRVDVPATLVVERGGERISVEIIPASRE